MNLLTPSPRSRIAAIDTTVTEDFSFSIDSPTSPAHTDIPPLRVSISPRAETSPTLPTTSRTQTSLKKTNNRARTESRKLLAHVLDQLERRNLPSSIFDVFGNTEDQAAEKNLGALLETVKDAVKIKKQKQEGRLQTQAGTVEDDSDDDGEHGFSTDATYDLMLQLKDVLIMSVDQGWYIFDENHSVQNHDHEPGGKPAISPFRRTRNSLQPVGPKARSRSPSPSDGRRTRAPELLSSCISILASIVLEDCRYQVASPRPSRPPNALQALTLDVARFLIHANRYDPNITRKIGFAMIPSFSTFRPEMHGRLLTFFETTVIRGMLENLEQIQGINDVSSGINGLEKPLNSAGSSVVEIHIDTVQETPNAGLDHPRWVPWSSAPNTALKLRSTHAPLQSLSLYSLSSVVGPLLATILECVNLEPRSDRHTDVLHRFCRLLQLIVEKKVDAYCDVLQVAGYHASKSRRTALAILCAFWPQAVGHIVVSRPFYESYTLEESGESMQPLKPRNHQFVPWRFPSNPDRPDLIGFSQHDCRSCSRRIRGFGLLCPLCMCGVHFDCYDHPDGSHLLQYALVSDPTVQRVAMYRFSSMSTERSTGSGMTQKHRHVFRPVNLFTLCLCVVCRKPLWGCTNQGLNCASCMHFIHTTCLSDTPASKIPPCSSSTLNSDHVNIDWKDLRRSCVDYHHDILQLSNEELATRGFEDISIFHAAMWIQLQIITSGIALGSVVVMQNGRNAMHAKHHEVNEFELHRVIKWCEDLLSSGSLPFSNAMDDYTEENHLAHSEHFMMFDWSNLMYICSVIRSPTEQQFPPSSSSELLSVTQPDHLLASTSEGSAQPFEAVPLSHMRDALGYGFNVHSDIAARHLLSHLHHLGLFNRVDHNHVLFNADNPTDIYCVFPLPFGLDLSPNVETLVATVEACLTDLDLSVNEVGFLLLARRLWPNGLASEYALRRLTRSILSWILAEDSQLAVILRDYLAKQKTLPGVRSTQDPVLWPSSHISRPMPSSSVNNGGDYLATRRTLLSRYTKPWLMALHDLDKTSYAALIYEACLEAEIPSANVDKIGVTPAVAHKDRLLRQCDKVLHFITRLSHISIAFDVFDELFLHWLESVTVHGLYEESIPSLFRLFPRETEGVTHYSTGVDHADLAAVNLSIEPWRVVTRVATESKEGLTRSLQWLCLFARSGIEIPLTTFKAFSTLDEREEIRLAVDAFSASLLPAHFKAISACWNESLSKAPITDRIRLVLFLIQLHPHFPRWRVLSWNAVVEALLEDDFDDDEPAAARLTLYCLPSDPSDPDLASLRVSLILLSLQMIADGIAIDSFILLKIKHHIVQVIGFRDISVVPSQNGQSFHVQFGDAPEIPVIALPCVNQFLSVMDASHAVDIAPSTMAGANGLDNRPVSTLVGSIFVDVFLAMFCTVKDLTSLPILTFKNMLETLCVIIYKHDFESRALKHLQQTLRRAVVRALGCLTKDISYDLRQLALSVTQAFVKRWHTFMGSIIYTAIESVATLVASQHQRGQDALAAQAKTFLDTTLTKYAQNGLFISLLKRLLDREFFVVLKQVTDANAKNNATSAQTLREQLLRDLFGRTIDADRTTFQNILNNMQAYVEIVFYDGYSTELMQFVGQQLTHLARRTSEWPPGGINPDPLLIICATLIHHNKSRSRDLLSYIDTVMRVLLNRLNVNADSLARLLQVTNALHRKAQANEPIPVTNSILLLMFEVLGDGLRLKARVPPPTVKSLLEVITTTEISGSLPPVIRHLPSLLGLVDSGIHFLQAHLWQDVDNDFAASLAVARMLLQVSGQDPTIMIKLSDHGAERTAHTNLKVRSWSILAVAALLETKENWYTALFAQLPGFSYAHHGALRVYAQGTNPPDYSIIDINHAYIAIKLWILLAYKVSGSSNIERDSQTSSVWNELWPPFEALIHQFEVDTRGAQYLTLGTLVLSSVADLFDLHTNITRGVGTIPQSSFEKYAAEIRSFDSVRLGDIPADHKDERARFMPSPLSTGYLHLSFPTHPPPRSHLPLSLLRPSHFPLAVIGVAACSKTDSLSSVYAQFNSSLIDIFPSDAIYPLAKNCFVFEESDDTNLSLGDDLPGLVVLPSMMGNKKLYIGTLLADLCSQILGEFGVVVQALESPLGNEYLNSTLLPTIPPLSEIPEPLNGSKRDSLPPLPSHNSQPDMSRASFTLSAAPMKRTSSGPGFRQSSMNPQPARKRMSTIGAASSHARLFKVLGDLFLLAGRPEDALVWYLEALQLFKSSQDFVWHAATLEGLATVSVIEAWSAAKFDDRVKGTVDRGDGEPNHSLLSYLYTCCILRHSSLLFAVWSAKGWGPLAFTTMLQPGPKPYLPPTLSRDDNTWAQLERLSTISGISRSSIAGALSQIHGPWLLHLGARERIAILEATSSLYACLGYRRKEAYILREVLGCILDLMVCGREEDGLSRMSSVPNTSGLGIQGLNSSGGGWSGVGVRMSESSVGNESILELLKYVCKVLGINLDAVKLVDIALNDDETTGDAGETVLLSHEDYDNDAVTGSVEPYGWPELQVGVVREAVAVAEALPDFPAVAQFALSALKTLQTVLSPGDQFHLYSTSSRALTTARRRGDTKSVEYWSGRPVVSITIAPMPLVRLPVEKPVSMLQSKSSSVTPILTGGTDPFLYNPRKAVVGQERTLVVQNETLEFVVILQNPYIFDLELQSLSLSTAGLPFESRPLRVLIPANSFHEVVLSGKALETGTLTIRGCRVQAPGGASREFIMPLSTDEEEQRLSRKRSSVACDAGRSKHFGIDSFPWERVKKRESRSPPTTIKASFQFLECKVVPEQPLLRIRRTSLTHGALMLYNGEMSTIRITLENVSPLPIDFLRLVFDDSTIAPAQQALAEGELSVFDTYETEYGLIQRPVFSWNNEEDKSIQPGQKLSLTVTCIGKVGCTNGTIHISYSYVHRERSVFDGLTEVFHTRQLSYPVMVTVYHMLECHSMDILPFPRHVPDSKDAADTQTKARRQTLYVDDEGSWCLFSIEVRNTYGLPFDVVFERLQEGVPPASVEATVPPGSMSRLVIPIRKFFISEEALSQPIPTLSDRQFVVQKSKLSDQEVRTQREFFWYREELFKCVRGRWRETGGVRSGDLPLRQQRMTLPMLETLRLENAQVQMWLVAYDSASTTDRSLAECDGKYYPPADEFVYLRTKVTNTSPSSQVFILDLEMEPSEHVVYEGILSELAIGRLESGESRQLDTAICFLAYGRFEISAEVRSFDSFRSDARAGIGRLIAVVRGDGAK
ncbi:hypothetical protein D9615_003973 [Tricholomella constricta]|uniref:Phorbol-ester/DAG-type domain-containing protein n=1 Tax=Tricholomella constricta TaxID=117010 RepID=A0A8H5M4I9_9AGAR|nr:hypothetical protein D9615_003973 [Tricholomella constricta]